MWAPSVKIFERLLVQTPYRQNLNSLGMCGLFYHLKQLRKSGYQAKEELNFGLFLSRQVFKTLIGISR